MNDSTEQPWNPVGGSVQVGRFVTPPPHLTCGVDPTLATGRTINWGIVATGAIARRVAPQIAALGDASIVAVSSRDERTARAFAATLGDDVRGYGNRDGRPGYAYLADDLTVEAVYVATPNAAHLEVARTMLQAGKHVVVEKTMVCTAREARELAAAAQNAGRFLMEGVWTRFLPLYSRVMEIVASGEIGIPVWFQGNLGFVAPEHPASRLWSTDDGGGVLLDLIVYPWTWICGIFGAPSDVQARVTLAPNGVDALLQVTFGYANGALATALGTFVSEASRTAVIAGTRGMIRINAALPNPRAIVVVTPDGERTEQAPEDPMPFTHQFREVTRCLQSGLLESPTMPLADSIAMMDVFDAVRSAARDGRQRGFR